MIKHLDIIQARRANPGKVIIWYPFGHGGQRQDSWMWCAEKDGEIIDYNTKDTLIENAKLDNQKIIVLTIHKNGQVSEKATYG